MSGILLSYGFDPILSKIHRSMYLWKTKRIFHLVTSKLWEPRRSSLDQCLVPSKLLEKLHGLFLSHFFQIRYAERQRRLEAAVGLNREIDECDTITIGVEWCRFPPMRFRLVYFIPWNRLDKNNWMFLAQRGHQKINYVKLDICYFAPGPIVRQDFFRREKIN